MATVARGRSICLGRFCSSVDTTFCFSFGRPLGIYSINTNTNFPDVPVGVTFPNLRVAVISSLGGHVKFLRRLTGGLRLSGIHFVRSHTRAFNRGGRCHRSFSIIATQTITELSILDRLYLPLTGANNAFITVGNTDTGRRLSTNGGTVSILNKALISSRAFALPRRRDRQGVLVVGGRGDAPGGCPQGPKAPGGAPVR